MLDQLKIGDKASFDDFGASVAKRHIGQPKKKKIKETVPFSNVTYDFSKINGELYWEERELEYTFEMTAATPEELEEAKLAFVDWVMNVTGENIFDPFIEDYHFVGTYDDMKFEDEEDLEKTTVTVTFTAYPFKVANSVIEHHYRLSAGNPLSVSITNNSSHRVVPTLKTSHGISILKDGVSVAISAGEYKDEALMLSPGINNWTILNTNNAVCEVSISFHEEVL